MPTQRTAASALFLSLLVLGACQRSDKSNNSSSTVDKSSAAASSDSAAADAKLTLPAIWPQDVPLVPGAKLTDVKNFGDKRTLTATFSVPDPFKDVVAFYTDKFAKLEPEELAPGPQMHFVAVKDAFRHISATVFRKTEAGPTKVQLVIRAR